jgi:hypothetical protein
MPEVTVRGVQFHYESCGSGEVLLCLPGALGTGESDYAPPDASAKRAFGTPWRLASARWRAARRMPAGGTG